MAAIPDYTTMDAFNGVCTEAIPSNPEDRVSTMWCFILNQAFPGGEGYVLAPQYQNTGGYTDITVAQYQRDNNAVLRRTSFLVIQAKKAGLEGAPAHWRDGELQLSRYLRALAQTRRNEHLYGIVAIGRFVKFYKYSRRSRRATLLRNRRRVYHVQNDVNMIIESLTYMKQNH